MISFVKVPRIFVVLLALISLSLACNLPSMEEEEGDEVGQAIQTQVAQTLEAHSTEEETQPTPLSTSTVPPEPIPAETPPEPDVTYEGISFSYPESLASAVITATDEGMVDEANPWNIPAHTLFLLEGFSISGGYHEPEIKIFSVQEFRNVNENVGESLDELAAILDAQPQDPPDIGVYHFFNAAQFLHSQEAYLEFQNGRGIRFISQYGQAAYPVGYPHMFYAFQGLTDDHAYYVSVILPISHPSLPEAESVEVDQAFYDNYETYLVDVEAQLDEQPPESFQPSLLVLDAMLETLRVDR